LEGCPANHAVLLPTRSGYPPEAVALMALSSLVVSYVP
jgi:hypothetical protein